MIQNIFVPETFQGRPLFSKKIVGIYQEGSTITLVHVVFSRTKIVIEKISTLPLPPHDGSLSTHENTLKKILDLIPRHATIITALSDSTILFKELAFPFNTIDKIKLVLGYEVEQFLPFSKADAISDFIVAATKDDTNTTIMSATVQKTTLFNHLAFYSQASINPHCVTTVSLAAVSYFKAIVENKTVAIIFLELHEIKLLYFYKNNLIAIRIIKKGFNGIIASLSSFYAKSNEEVYAFIKNDDSAQAKPTDFALTYQKLLKELCGSIKLTLESCTPLDAVEKNIPEIIMTGSLIHNLPEVVNHCQEILHVSCTPLSIDNLLKKNNITTEVPVDHNHVAALFVALSQNKQPHFNFRKEEFAQKNTTLLIQQLSIGLLLVLSLMISMITYYKYQIGALKKEIQESTQEVSQALKEYFKIPKEETDLQDILDLADQVIIKERETWFAFSYANQSRFLHYLLELTNKIDKKSLGFIPEKITIIEGTLTLKARVKDYDALKLLEKELKSSPLFIAIEPQDTPQFTMKISLAPTHQELL